MYKNGKMRSLETFPGKGRRGERRMMEGGGGDLNYDTL
jgi:hypothetical protein